MALLNATFMSSSLLRNVPMTVVLPSDRPAASERGAEAEAPYKTLYLLHGIYGNHLSWISGSRIVRLAERKNLAVVMPSGDNGFYVDHPGTHDHYGSFVGEELVDITRRMFPLSRKREDTFIAGLSMGGFGALRNGLKYHDTFSRIAAFSSALILEKAVGSTYGEAQYMKNRGFFEACFGDLEEAQKGDMNPKALVSALKATMSLSPGVSVPGIYLSCGTDDPLIDVSRDFRDFLARSGFGCEYYEGPGAHDWDFWDAEIEKALDWLPL